jgi:hypothetical protein
MSVRVETRLGTIIRLPNPPHWALWMECCQDWERMDDRQFRGEISVDHSRVCKAGSGYHETHDFRAALHDALLASPSSDGAA